jgi:precorrin-6B methylase 2
MSRAPKQDIAFQEKLTIPKEFLRFATPRDVSLYRAERLKCNVLVEIGAGIGGQTIPFSKQCKKVIAIELDKTRAKILLDNLKKLRINNVEVINGDALNKSVIQKIAKENPDIIFVDTERPEQSERTLKEIKPSV